jgi:hypothetical protein
MTFRGLIILAVFASVAVSLQAQTTWGNLQFGMSVAQTQEVLAGQSLELKSTDGKPDHFTVMPGYTLQTHGVIPTINFRVEVDFDKLGLSHIGLRLDQARTLDGQAASNVTLVRELPDEIENLLSAKYGKRVYRQGGCDNSLEAVFAPVPQKSITCESTWGTKGDK